MASQGWRILLEAFAREFAASEGTVLYILTSSFHSDSEFDKHIQDFIATLNLSRVAPPVRVLTQVPQNDMPGLYNGADAFVLPSRGEGWGRPHVEAMASGIPVIATNWSGTTAFMDDSNAYPLRIEGLVAIQEGPFAGHMWAQPSTRHLRQLMREVFSDRAGAARRGAPTGHAGASQEH